MGYETINPKQASERMQADKQVVYLDVRSEQEFAQGHPEGAVNVPIAHVGAQGMSPNPDFLKVVSARFQKTTPLVVGCKMGGRSARACDVLEGAGFGNVKNVDGGFSGRPDASDAAVQRGWSGSGLPVAKTPAKGATYSEMKAGL